MAHTENQSMDKRAVAYIESLAANSAKDSSEDVWYCIAACAFAACNEGKYVANIFQTAIAPHPSDIEKHKYILLRIKGL
ncbi:hypothetical protein EJ08DRAFT_464399 [Tothia fuscella]|uniref:Uncharacterized protein n=1 Tax=Tothia fuscella TaxID=1048955 RepID=A0A9P4TU69_9PEZI|nr:hypothetical protein EJ08DRAFT_464399 [Tothia fuscella]